MQMTDSDLTLMTGGGGLVAAAPSTTAGIALPGEGDAY